MNFLRVCRVRRQRINDHSAHRGLADRLRSFIGRIANGTAIDSKTVRVFARRQGRLEHPSNAFFAHWFRFPARKIGTNRYLLGFGVSVGELNVPRS